MWKAVFTHLLRILYAAGGDTIQELSLHPCRACGYARDRVDALALVNTALHAEFALACALDECMAATARAGVVRIAVAARIAVTVCIASVARIAITACLAVLARASMLLVYFSGLLVCRALPLRKIVFCAQRPEGSHQHQNQSSSTC